MKYLANSKRLAVFDEAASSRQTFNIRNDERMRFRRSSLGRGQTGNAEKLCDLD